ncbi:hypothetical protein J8273_5335 [Carpediemonas membranifera]|uniref:Serine-threonine/tyrosine-protein kinase catalytic domain-containing protein n=1 Tax=Carpediemonas membranifera TaxID=201153 RepID=A0A8J6ATY1_9EUKA|nr:hypothetical protein J8273_5335 [Carpediemonas membranifera]|eukprot:KAG9392345.1 hypothetical protein J8273_5335 [Carpediemonas membranifera]
MSARFRRKCCCRQIGSNQQMWARIWTMLSNLLLLKPSLLTAESSPIIIGIVIVVYAVIIGFALLTMISVVLFLSILILVAIALLLLLIIKESFIDIVPKDEAVMVPPNPDGKPLVRLTDDQVHVERRIDVSGYNNNIVVVPFNHNEVYYGRVTVLKKRARVLAHMIDSEDHLRGADAALAAAEAQHAANITGVCRLYGYMRNKQFQFIFRERPTRELEFHLTNSHAKWAWETRLQMARDVATTMAQAHAQGLTHGNLCGTTILVFNDHAKIDYFGTDNPGDIEDLAAYDLNMFGRLLWRIVHRRPTPYDSVDMQIPAPNGCPAELAAAVAACVSPAEKPASFAAICDILGKCTKPESADGTVSASAISPQLGFDEARLVQGVDEAHWDNIYETN